MSVNETVQEELWYLLALDPECPCYPCQVVRKHIAELNKEK